jgi:[ribosomal protein S18]-alanine N-acetyltransferase
MIREHPGQSPVIARMVEADLDDVMDIERESFKAPWSRSVFMEELVREWAHLWVLRPADGGPVAAFINFWLVRDEIHILNVAVHPRFRRAGYASQLLQSTIEFAWKKRVRYLTLEVRRSNNGAIKLYRSFDFKPIGIRPNYYAEDKEDAIVMLLTLGLPSS